jgi:nitrogen regulatory protein P-II 1
MDLIDREVLQMMIMVEAIVREEKIEEVKEALSAIEVNGISISQVMGHGSQKGYVELVRATEVSVNLIPKIKFEIIVSSEEWEQKTINAIKDAAFTGEPGDGKIFSYSLRSVIRIRTGETDYDALN